MIQTMVMITKRKKVRKMFNPNNIYRTEDGGYACDHFCSSKSRAEEISVSFRPSLKEIDFRVELLSYGSKLILSVPDKELLEKLIPLVNRAIENM